MFELTAIELPALQLQENKCFHHWNVDFHSIYHRYQLLCLNFVPEVLLMGPRHDAICCHCRCCLIVKTSVAGASRMAWTLFGDRCDVCRIRI